jgi:hypothetical protein
MPTSHLCRHHEGYFVFWDVACMCKAVFHKKRIFVAWLKLHMCAVYPKNYNACITEISVPSHMHTINSCVLIGRQMNKAIGPHT